MQSANNKLNPSTLNKIHNIFYGWFQIQPEKRNFINQLEIVLNYTLTYAIFYFIIIQIFGKSLHSDQSSATQSEIASTLLFSLFFIRLGMVLSYAIFQKNLILMIDKLAILTSLIIHTACFQVTVTTYQQILIICLEVVMYGIWAFKGQNRILHFDSRLFSIYPFLKEVTILMMVLSVKFIEKQHQSEYADYEKMFSTYEIHVGVVIIVGIISFFIVDKADFIYRRKFKDALIYLDCCLLAIFVAFVYGAYEKNEQVDYRIGGFMTATLLVFGTIMLNIYMNSFSILFQIQTEDLDKCSEAIKLNYFATLKSFISDKQQRDEKTYRFQLDCFIRYHKEKCLTPTCPFNARYSKQTSTTLLEKQSLVQEFLIKQLERTSEKKQNLTKLLIFILSPKNKVLKYLKKEVPYMARQHNRVMNDPRQKDNEFLVIEGKHVMQQIQQHIKIYLQSGKAFYKNLLYEELNSEIVVQKGFQMIDAIDKIKSIKQNPQKLTQDVRILLNNFSSKIIKQKTKILQNLMSPAFMIQSSVQSGPILIISAQTETFLQILDANIACCKHFYLTKEEFLKLKATDLQPVEIRDKHSLHFTKVSKNVLFDGQKDFPYNMFAKNKLGYMVLFQAIMYLLNSIKGRMWYACLKITHDLDSIILIGDYAINNKKKSSLIGMTDLCVHHGFKLAHEGQYFSDELVRKLKEKGQNELYKNVIINAYEPLFQDNSFQFTSQKRLKIIQKVNAFGFTYYLVNVTSYEASLKRKSSKFNDSLVSQSFIDELKNQNKQNDIQNSFQITKILQPVQGMKKFQFHYHSNGNIRTQEEKQDSIILNFSDKNSESLVKLTKSHEKLDKDIVEMRLCGNTLDFLQNIQKQQDFDANPTIPNQTMIMEQNKLNVSLQIYYQSYEIRKKTSSKWLKIFRFSSLLVIILIALLTTSQIYFSQTRYAQSKKQTKILNNLNNIIQNYLRITIKILDHKYYNSISLINFTDISLIISENQVLFKQLFAIYPNIQETLSQQKYNSLMQNYQINVNNFLTYTSISSISQFNQSALLSQSSQFSDMFDEVYVNLLKYYATSKRTFLDWNSYINLGLIGLIISLFIGVIFVTKYLNNKESQILQIFLKLKDSIYTKQLSKIRLFEEYFYFNKDLLSQQDIQYKLNAQQNKQKQNVQNILRFGSFLTKKRSSFQRQQNSSNNIKFEQYDPQQDNPYLKKLYKPYSRKMLILLFGVWVIAQVSCLISHIYKVQSYQKLNYDMKFRRQQLSQISVSSYLAWIQFHQFSASDEKKLQHIGGLHEHWNNFRYFTYLYSNNEFSDKYIDFYTKMWSGDFCSFLKSNANGSINPNSILCYSQYNGMLTQGVDQILAYLFRKLSFLKNKGYSPTQFRSLQLSRQISYLINNYLSKVYSINSLNLLPEFKRMSDAKINSFRINEYIFCINLLFLVLFYYVLNSSHNRLMKMERMLNLLQFQEVKKNRTFKNYFKENCYNVIYK